VEQRAAETERLSDERLFRIYVTGPQLSGCRPNMHVVPIWLVMIGAALCSQSSESPGLREPSLVAGGVGLSHDSKPSPMARHILSPTRALGNRMG
jgi:hypothetical protein